MEENVWAAEAARVCSFRVDSGLGGGAEKNAQPPPRAPILFTYRPIFLTVTLTVLVQAGVLEG